MSVEQIAFDAEPKTDSTPIEELTGKTGRTYGEIMNDPKWVEWRGMTNQEHQLRMLGQTSLAEMTRVERLARIVPMEQQRYEIERDEL